MYLYDLNYCWPKLKLKTTKMKDEQKKKNFIRFLLLNFHPILVRQISLKSFLIQNGFGDYSMDMDVSCIKDVMVKNIKPGAKKAGGFWLLKKEWCIRGQKMPFESIVDDVLKSAQTLKDHIYEMKANSKNSGTTKTTKKSVLDISPNLVNSSIPEALSSEAAAVKLAKEYGAKSVTLPNGIIITL